MLCLSLYTLIIGHKSCKKLSIKNKLTLQKELQNFVTNYVFLDKNSKTQQQYKTSNKQEMSSKKTNGVGLKTHTQG